jgi:hypothetical protein
MASEDLIIKHAMGEGPGESAPVGPEPPAIKPPAEEPLPDVLPVLPLGDLVVFPGMVAPLVINTQRSTKLIDDVVAGGRYLIGALQKNRAASDDQVQLADVHPESTVLRLLKMLKFPDDTVRVLVQGHARCLLGGPPSDTAPPPTCARTTSCAATRWKTPWSCRRWPATPPSASRKSSPCRPRCPTN